MEQKNHTADPSQLKIIGKKMVVALSLLYMGIFAIWQQKYEVFGGYRYTLKKVTIDYTKDIWKCEFDYPKF